MNLVDVNTKKILYRAVIYDRAIFKIKMLKLLRMNRRDVRKFCCSCQTR